MNEQQQNTLKTWEAPKVEVILSTKETLNNGKDDDKTPDHANNRGSF